MVDNPFADDIDYQITDRFLRMNPGNLLILLLVIDKVGASYVYCSDYCVVYRVGCMFYVYDAYFVSDSISLPNCWRL